MTPVEFARSVVVKAPVQRVFEFTNSASGFQQHFPHPVVWEEGPPAWRLGDEISFRYRFCGVWIPYRAEIVEWRQNRSFVDEMRNGPFRFFRHTHRFESIDGGTRYTDQVQFNLGYGGWIDRTLGACLMNSLFRKRQARMKALLESQ